MYCPLDRSRPCPFRLKPTEVYLGEDDLGYYTMEMIPYGVDEYGLGFLNKIGNMFKRMVKFTPKSFTPSNIFKAVRNTTLTTMTGGAYLVLPKSVKKTMENVANIAMPVAAAGIAAVTLGPAVMGVLGPKLSAVAGALGKNMSSIGSGLFNMLGRLPQAKQAEVAQQVTPQDIQYAETHGGQYPPHVMDLIYKAEREAYGYAALNAMNPTTIQQPATSSLYADAALYPRLQELYAQQSMPQETESMPVAGIVGLAVGGTALLALLLKK